DLLAGVPEGSLWDRLQFVREAFYQEVVASGAGEPVDVPPFRVEEMLAGGEATPYEITAAEVMIARWTGVPARMGYGFYGGEKTDAGGTRWQVRPKHGATWLEAYFDGYGWVPIIGKPPKAKPSTADEEKQDDPEIRPSDELALVVYVPIKLQSIRLLYTLVRYYVMVTLPVLGALLLTFFLFPYPVRVYRRYKRRRWAEARGPLERIVVSYAEFRDLCEDHNVGDTVRTPLEFLEAVEPDAEHTEFAWLVTRALWGDLLRDLRMEDAEAAQDMSRSLMRRVRVAQPALSRVLAVGSRASLRAPYTDDVPNTWPRWAAAGMVRRGLRRLFGVVGAPLRRVRRLLPAGAGAVLLLLLMVGCGRPDGPVGVSRLPDPLVPEDLQGYVFAREEQAESAFERAGADSLVEPDGRVYTVRRGSEVLGSLQAAVFKRELRLRDEDTRREVLDSIRSSIGSGGFDRKRVGAFTIEEMVLPEQRILLWMPPDAGYYQLFIARQGFEAAERVFTAVLAYQRGDVLSVEAEGTGLPDPTRGVPE
ncbi:MAG TPA: transglutaminase-like domain-containing protein, partial [Actinomycetota bacterium]|nr:transglutaminase-like domain-containing protein [Actinomycetota bacterium]